MIKTFEEAICWKKAEILAFRIYSLFKDNRDYGFRDQIQRASVSIMNNVAEGFERKSNNEFRQFLYIAKGSCGEVRSMLHIAQKLGYLNADNFTELHKLSLEISKTISGLIRSIEN